MISILCPSRERPRSLQRLLESIQATANNVEDIEVLIYLDNDDESTIERDFTNYSFVRFFRGNRMWMSLMQNFLYSQSDGDFIMACADDFVFKTVNWDKIVVSTFASKTDPFWVLYGNDLGVHAGKLPTHFFLSRAWPNLLGTWVHPGRNSPWDLWIFDVARALNRLEYLGDLKFEHLNFRQSKSPDAVADATTKTVSEMSYIVQPLRTYKKLERERRIDTLLVCQAIGEKAPLSHKYLLSHILVLIGGERINNQQRVRLLSTSNLEIVGRLLRYIIRPK